MRRIHAMAIFTFLIVLTASICFSNADGPLAPAPIRITDEIDNLRLINSYQAALSAQTQFENAVLRAKVKYKVPIDYSYNFDGGQFEPPRQVAQTVPPAQTQPSTKAPEPKPK